MSRPRAVDAGLAFAATTLAFAGGFGLYPWYDDWMYMSAAGSALARRAPGEFLFGAFPPHWSPIAFAFELLNLQLVAWRSDTLIRSTVAVMVFAGLLLFASFARRLGLNGVAVAAGIGTLALHHSNAAAFYAFDCYDQIAADLATWAALLIVWHALDAPPGRTRRWLAAAAAIYAPALLVKEEALALPMCVLLIAAWLSARRKSAPATGAVWALWLGLSALSAAFALLRWRAGLLFEADGPYRLCVSCVPANVGLLLASLAIPVRTLDVFVALQRSLLPREPAVILAAAATAACVALLVAGVTRHVRRRGSADAATLAALLLPASFFPTILLPGVTELYAHTALFWFAVLVAMAVDGWLPAGIERARDRLLVAGAAAVYLLTLGFSLRANLADMRASGERSRAWRERIHAALAPIPPGRRVLLRGLLMTKAPGDYGLYRVTAPGYLLAGATGVAWRGRTDLAVCTPDGVCEQQADYVADIVEASGQVRVGRRRAP